MVVSLDEEDALERVSGARLHPDLIVLDEVGVPLDEAVNAARRIRREAELDKSVPIVVMAEKYGEEMAGKDVQVGEHEYITYLEDGQQLERLLTRLAPPHA